MAAAVGFRELASVDFRLSLVVAGKQAAVEELEVIRAAQPIPALPVAAPADQVVQLRRAKADRML